MIFRGLVAEKTDESLFFVDTKQEKSVGKGNLYILHCNTVLRVHRQKDILHCFFLTLHFLECLNKYCTHSILYVISTKEYLSL